MNLRAHVEKVPDADILREMIAFRGLALIVQETLKRDPRCGDLFVFRGRGAISLNAGGPTAGLYACSPNDSNAASFCGRRRLMEW
jgi:hypothetical protein